MSHETNYYTETVSAFRSLADNGACRFPREPYNPHDLLPHQHEALRAAWYRAARRDGLDEDAAEEAASWAYAHWLGRNYANVTIGRGDHLRAYASVRRLGGVTRWRGMTGRYRAARRKITRENIARQERMREQHQPRPDSMAIAAERLEWSERLVHRMTTLSDVVGAGGDVASLLRMAAGVDLPAGDTTDTTTEQTDTVTVSRVWVALPDGRGYWREIEPVTMPRTTPDRRVGEDTCWRPRNPDHADSTQHEPAGGWSAIILGPTRHRESGGQG